MSKKLLRVTEVSRILDIRDDRVYELCREGLLPHVRLGRQIRIDPDVLEAWIRKGGQSWAGGWRREA